MARHTGRRFSVKRMHELTPQALTTLWPDATQVLAGPRSLGVLDGLQPQSNTLEQTVQKPLHPTPPYEQLRTVQGSGTIVAQPIPLETGAIRRFPPVGHSASSCRGVDSTTSSNGTRQGTGHGKKGHPSLAGASMEAAQFAMRCQPEAQRFAHRELAQSRTKTLVARTAVAQKLSRACYDSMRDRVPSAATTACG